MQLNSTFKLFPYFVARFCSRPAEEFMSLNFPNLDKIIKIQEELSEKTKKNKLEIIKDLYNLFPKINNHEIKNKILTIKRSVYNERKVSEEDVNQLLPFVSQKTVTELNYYRILIQKKARLIKQQLKSYSVKIKKLRKKLIILSRNYEFQNGIFLSSSDFYKSLKNYLDDLPVSNLKKFELTLIKYLSRFYFKTSPFSTFTCIDIQNINEKNSSRTKVFNWKSRIYLNNYLFRYLKNLLQINPQISNLIPIQLNKTIIKKGGHYTFIANDRNKEAIQHITTTPALDYFYNIFLTDKPNSISEFLTIFRSKNQTNTKEKEIIIYLKQLIDYNFLEFNWGISELDFLWYRKLKKSLSSLITYPEIKRIIELLDYVGKSLEIFAAASLIKRERILKNIFSKTNKVCSSLQSAANLKINKDNSLQTDKQTKIFKISTETEFNFKPNQLIFEDSSVNYKIHFPSEKIREVTRKLYYLSKALSLSNHLLKDHEEILHFFLKKYDSQKKIDLMKFYEDFSADAQLKNNDKSKTENPLTKARIKLTETNFQKIVQMLKKERQDFLDEIRLTENHLNLLTPDNSLTSKDFPVSLSAYLQLYTGKNNELKAVINGSSLGFGKMFSRFLYMFDPQIISVLRQWNKPISPTLIFAENSDSSDLNVNMHPPLMPFEIETSTNENKMPSDALIAIRDLQVEFNKEINKLQFVLKFSNKKVYFLDLGFQGPMGRSGLFKFINSFYTSHCVYPYPLMNSINQSIQTSKQVKILPRIVFADQIILQRKTWILNKKNLPFQNKSEPDADYFFRLNKWRLENNLPEEIFIQISNFDELTHNEENITVGKDDYKPQYINFSNPFLVLLFRKLLNKVPNKLLISEMLPNSDSLLTKRVTEFLFQWYL